MAARPDPTSSKPPLVGFEADMNIIMNAMLDPSVQELTVVDIVGSRGVGKTYLAKEVYTSPEVQRHFDVHVWFPAAHYHSTTYWAIQDMMKQLSIKDKANISNFLRDKRYCVVFDDLNGEWIWSDILRRLPDNNNGSRILVTRRPEYRECSYPIPTSKLQCELGPRSNKQSLEMLLQAAFPKDPWDGCPAGKVDDLARQFVRKCGGLPWPLRFLGGLLTELPWNEVLGRIQAIEAAGMSFVQFAMSYRDLPSHNERVAFLYFLNFPEGTEIRAKSLVRMFEIEDINFSYNFRWRLSAKKILEDLAERSYVSTLPLPRERFNRSRNANRQKVLCGNLP
ncbi:Disease resistance protein [Rhynchospora pubera]|uniref:Disease resistance protein n=1 Tax=Rhynchospora pubera TaxID=906938 RepID=A0AAV8BR52_9POAL|nr:Disease resistance protein [Rhynchospora pubera]